MHRQNRSSFPLNRHGFTLVELLAVVGISVFLFALVVHAAANANESDNRTKCASNLNQIGQAMILYANDNLGQFPRGIYDSAHADKPNAYTAATVTDPFAKEGPVNDVTAALFLLLRTQDIPTKAFICPSSGQSELRYADGKKATAFANFQNNESLSYSLQNPYFGNAALGTGAKWNNTLPQEFVIAADMNPGTDGLTKLKGTSSRNDLRQGNSKNHQQDGQNVLFADGHVDFTRTPFCGEEHDNIFTYGASGNDAGGDGIKGPAQSASDSILLPTANEKGPEKK